MTFDELFCYFNDMSGKLVRLQTRVVGLPWESFLLEGLLIAVSLSPPLLFSAFTLHPSEHRGAALQGRMVGAKVLSHCFARAADPRLVGAGEGSLNCWFFLFFLFCFFVPVTFTVLMSFWRGCSG